MIQDKNQKPATAVGVNQLADVQDREIEELKRFILSAEESLEAAKTALTKLTGEEYKTTTKSKPLMPGLSVSDNGKVIEGIFDGENMLGPDGKIFPVPANYASKSKLIEGDKLKLTVAEDGAFIFKQIGPAERKKIIGTLSFENNVYHVLAEGKSFNVLYASVTYFKAKPGDRVTIVVPSDEDSNWGALENVIHEVESGDKGEGLNDKSDINAFPEIPDYTNEKSDEPQIKTQSTGLPDGSLVEHENADQNNLGEIRPSSGSQEPADELEI